MSGQDDHPHIPHNENFLSPAPRRRHRPASPVDEDLGLDSHFNFQPSRPLSLLDIDVYNGVRSYPAPTMDLQQQAAAEAAQQQQLAAQQQQRAAQLSAMTLEERLLSLIHI